MFHVGNRSIVVLETGVGPDRARRAVNWFLDQRRQGAPDLVITAGFAGALSRTLSIGDIVVASEVIEPDDIAWRVALPAELGDLICGRILTWPRMVTTPTEKKALFDQTKALAVDMESGSIAETCVARRVPCAVVRAVSDTSEEGLSPELLRLLDGGQVSLLRVFGRLVRRPRLIGELWRLQRATRRASRNLAEALWRLLD